MKHSHDRVRGYFLLCATALFVAAPLIPSESAATAGTGIPLVMLWLVLALVWMLMALLRRRLAWRWGWMETAFAAWITWHTVSGLVMMRLGTPRYAINMIWEGIAFGVGFLLLRQVLQTAAECRAVVAVMLGLAAMLSTQGLYQSLHQLPQQRAVYERASPSERAAIRRTAGIHAPEGSPQARRFSSRLSNDQPMARFGLTNSLAGFLTPWIVMVVGIGAAQWRGEGPGRRAWIGLACSLLLMSACLLLTKSRTAWLATAVGCGAALLVCSSRRTWDRRIVVAAAGLCCLALIVMAVIGTVDPGVLSGAPASVRFRLEYWQATWAMIADQPWFGCGPGNFQDAYTQYKLPQASEEIRDPHNFLLEIWATAGTPAARALLAAIACFFARTVYRWGWVDDGCGSTTVDGRESVDAGGYTVYAGAILGFVVAALVAIPVGFPLDFVLLGMGLPVATVVLVLLHEWVSGGRLPPLAVPLAVFALLLNLAAAGGINYPGVAGSLWMLSAIGLASAGGSAFDRDRVASSGLFAVAVPACIVLGAAAALCLSTAYTPTLQMGSLRRRFPASWLQPRPGTTDIYPLVEQTDPYSPIPWQMVANHYLSQWRQSGQRPADWHHFSHAAARALSLSPRSSSSYQLVGTWYVEAYQVNSSPDALRSAAEAYRRAVQLYPHNGMLHAELAWILSTLQERPAAVAEATLALQLDDQNPHSEQKLAERRIFIEVSGGPAAGFSDPNSGKSARAWLEQLVMGENG